MNSEPSADTRMCWSGSPEPELEDVNKHWACVELLWGWKSVIGPWSVHPKRFLTAAGDPNGPCLTGAIGVIRWV